MAKHTARKVRPVDTDDTKKGAVMQDAKKAEELFTQGSSRAVEAMTLWADANQRVVRELAELSAATAKEGVRLYAELQQAGVEVLRDTQAAALRWQIELAGGRPRSPRLVPAGADRRRREHCRRGSGSSRATPRR